jgi:hypothetical protein
LIVCACARPAGCISSRQDKTSEGCYKSDGLRLGVACASDVELISSGPGEKVAEAGMKDVQQCALENFVTVCACAKSAEPMSKRPKQQRMQAFYDDGCIFRRLHACYRTRTSYSTVYLNEHLSLQATSL